MTNIIYIKNASYDEVKKALQQWIALYADDLDPAFTFRLPGDLPGHIIMKADEKLSNGILLSWSIILNILKISVIKLKSTGTRR